MQINSPLLPSDHHSINLSVDTEPCRRCLFQTALIVTKMFLGLTVIVVTGLSVGAASGGLCGTGVRWAFYPEQPITHQLPIFFMKLGAAIGGSAAIVKGASWIVSYGAFRPDISISNFFGRFASPVA